MHRNRPVWRTLFLLAFVRVLISSIIVQRGALALSDDDYARVTIAQRFAAHPSWDPSGTSWLPFPFWVIGALMKLFDPTLDTARSLSTALAVAATWLLYAGGRLWGLSPRNAFGAALAVNLVPAAAVLGGMTVPEFPTAALCVFALLAISGPSRGGRFDALAPWMAGVAVVLASLSRYEAWPVAAVVGALVAQRAFTRERGPAAWVGAALQSALPLAGAVGWVVHNQHAHGDALSFLHRVASYRAALGSPAGASTASYVTALIGGCPAVAFAVALLVFLFRRHDRAAFAALTPQLAPLGLGALSVLAFLIAGDALGGAPTHHPERALLTVWMLAVFGCARMLGAYRPPSGWWLPVALLLVLDFREQLAGMGSLRASEELAGLQLRSLALPGERVVIATPDYGYLAVNAALARPQDALIDRTYDPRNPREIPIIGDPWSAPERLGKAGARWVVAPSSTLFPSALQLRSHAGALTVFELSPSHR